MVTSPTEISLRPTTTVVPAGAPLSARPTRHSAADRGCAHQFLFQYATTRMQRRRTRETALAVQPTATQAPVASVTRKTAGARAHSSQNVMLTMAHKAILVYQRVFVGRQNVEFRRDFRQREVLFFVRYRWKRSGVALAYPGLAWFFGIGGRAFAMISITRRT